MTLVQSYLTKNDCYKIGKKIKVKGLMLHSVGVPQPSAKVFVNNWNKSGIEKCVHAFIDANDGKVYQTLPWDHRGWHGGSGKNGSVNDTHIGVEMCEPSQIKYTGGANFNVVGNKDNAIAMVNRTYKSAVELFAQLCVKYNLDPMTQIISHSEGAAKGIASNHGDPVHLWKQLGLSYTMDGFRKDVAAEVAKVKTPAKDEIEVKEPEVPKTETPTAPELPFKVKIEVTNLRIRTGPGTNYAVTGRYTGVGVFTITEVQNGSGSNTGWGKLASGAGWVSLDFVKKL